MKLLISYNKFKNTQLERITNKNYELQDFTDENLHMDFDDFKESHKQHAIEEFDDDMKDRDFLHFLLEQFDFDKVEGLLHAKIELDDLLSKKFAEYCSGVNKDRVDLIENFCIDELDHEDIKRIIKEN